MGRPRLGGSSRTNCMRAESRRVEWHAYWLRARRRRRCRLPFTWSGPSSRTTQRRFLRAQWELSQRLPTHIVMLPGQNHLFPVTRPDLVLHHIERM